MWREWCFLRALVVRMWRRFAVLAFVLVVSAALFQRLGPEPDLTFVKGVYYAWSLLFAQQPIPLPDSGWLRSLYFLLPVLGLTVIIETLVEFALLLRDRRKAEYSWCAIMASSLRHHIIIVGLGRLGFRVFGLLRKLGHEVVVVELDPQNSFADDVRRDGSPLFTGDARRESLLAEAGVAHARAIIVATNNDLANLEIALDARRLAPYVRVVLRMFDQALANKIAGASNIHVAMSQSWISAPAFATAAIEPTIVNSAIINNQLVVIERWTLTPSGALTGTTVSQAAATHQIGIVESNGRLFPTPDLRLSPGDRVLVQGLYETMRHLRARA